MSSQTLVATESRSDARVRTISRPPIPKPLASYMLWKGDIESFLDALQPASQFQLIVTSPPYNLGKDYEIKLHLDDYIDWQERVITRLAEFLQKRGSICWQVGNYVKNGTIVPLDIELAPVFRRLGFQLRNRIIWRYGHGLHCKKRFSGRYEVVLWYTRSDNYTFNLDAVRVPSKYPGKKAFKGPRAGQYSGHPLGKNPEDVWDIPNVKSNHIEKTEHPCQFPVGLIERLVLALTNPRDRVFDPFAGVGSAGVASAIHGRCFCGCEIVPQYIQIAKKRLVDALAGRAQYRPHDKPIYDHRQSNLSNRPEHQ